MSDWLNPLNRIEIQRAVRAKAPQVVLDTVTFDITYMSADLLHIKPVPSHADLVPRGYFVPAKVRDPLWLTEGKHGEQVV